MEPLISGSSVSFQVGSRVRITGLVEAKQHNSKMGTVCNAIEVGTGRLGVDLDEGGTLKIKACNLVALSPTPASLSGSAFSSPASTLSTEDPPAPARCASWVSAAQAQSFSIQALVDRIVCSDIEIIKQFQDHNPPHPNEALQNELVRTHHLCDSLSQWADPIDAATFFTSANPASWPRLLDLSLVQLTMHFDPLQDAHPPHHDDADDDDDHHHHHDDHDHNDFIERFYKTELRKQKIQVMNQLRSCCNGCNTASGGCETAATATIMPRRLEPFSHTGLCLLSLCISFLRWQNAALEQAQDALLVLLATPRTYPQTGSVTIITVNLAIELVNDFFVTPHTALLAASLISFVVARRPAVCFGLIPPQSAVRALVSLLRGIFNLVNPRNEPQCLTEEFFGTVQVINVLPLLYYICDWPESASHVRRLRLPELVFTIATTLVHNWAHKEPHHSPVGICRKDCPTGTVEFPELDRARIHIRSLLGASAEALLHRRPVTFAAAALLEILARWSKRASISLSGIAATPGCSVDDLFDWYRSSWCDMAKATTDVAFIVPLVAAGAQGAKLPHRKKAQPSLLYSLANCSLLCALPGCCERSCVVSGKKLLLCAGCRWTRDGCWMYLINILRVRSGLARYCCPDHQRLHWQVLLLLVPPLLQLRSLPLVAQCSSLFRRTSPRAIDGGAQKGGSRVMTEV